MEMNLKDYDFIIINSSAGKDSLCAMWQIIQMAKDQNYPLSKIVGSHQDLGESEWKDTKELFNEQCELFGILPYHSSRRNYKGESETLLEYVVRHGKWPDNKNRWCTSDFKRGPGLRVMTRVTKDLGVCKVLYVFGFRAEESPSRSKKEVLKINVNASTMKRKVYEYLPIHDWTMSKVWDTIKSNNLPYHFAYDLGMPRLSCMFCIFSPLDALVIAGRHNPELLDKYIEAEKKIGHTFRHKFSIAEVKNKILEGYNPKTVSDWVM